MDIKKFNESLDKILKMNEETITNKERLIAYCDHILDALVVLATQEFPYIEETQEYEDIKYYANQIKSDLESIEDLDTEI